MNKRLMVVLGGAVLVFTAALAGAWILTLPATPELTAAPSISRQEAEATLAALKPPKRERPLVAILGINEATEVTDYLMPYGILKRSGVADVLALATHAGPVRLYPALKAEPDATTSQFDSQYPDGADYVVVPAMDPGDDPAALEWLRSQADKGAKIISVCAGAKVLGRAGLLDNRRATTHWFFVKELRERTPSLQYVPDRRLVVDHGVATTTGITASMPMMLTLIDAIAGREKAEAAVSRNNWPRLQRTPDRHRRWIPRFVTLKDATDRLRRALWRCSSSIPISLASPCHPPRQRAQHQFCVSSFPPATVLSRLMNSFMGTGLYS